MAKIEIKQEIKDSISTQSGVSKSVQKLLDKDCKVSTGYKMYTTTNYDMFKRLMGNRDVTSVNRIIESIQKIGYVDNPLIVNEKLEIIDGQNRLEAFRELGYEVPFHIVEGIGIDEARQMNIGRGNWKPIDWIKSYAETGNQNYIDLLKFWEMTHFDISLMIQISKKMISHTSITARAYNDGSYEMSKDEKTLLTNTLPWLIKIKPIIDSMTGNKRLRYMAFAFCYNVKGVDRKRLQMIIERDYFNIIPYPDPDNYLKEISKWYNKGLKTTTPLRFDYIYLSNNNVTN